MIRQPYTTDTFASDFKDLDGSILEMVCYIDVDLATEDLVDMDDGVRDILVKEGGDSAAILEEDQDDLIICMNI